MRHRLPQDTRQVRHARKVTRVPSRSTSGFQSPRSRAPEHRLGVGKHRAVRPAGPRVFGSALAALALVGGGITVASAARTAPEAEATASKVVVELQAGPDEVMAIAAAQNTCDSVHLVGEDREAHGAKAAAAKALEALRDAVNVASAATDTVFVLDGVPDEVVADFQSSTLPLRRLFTAASSLEVTSKDAVDATAATQAPDSVAVPKVTAPLNSPATQQIDAAAKQLDEAVAQLPAVDRVAVLGADAVDATTLSDEELDEIIAADGGEPFEIEKENRFVASLPDLSQVENGRLDDSLLCPIPWVSPYYRVLCASLPGLVALNDEFKANFGHDLPIQSAYRTYDEQVISHQNAPYMTTLPGTSNHSWGLAVDFSISDYRTYDVPEVQWLVEHAPSHGWRNPTLESFGTAKPEPWHFEFGTTYPDNTGASFNGPTPLVEYVVRLPEGIRPETLLTTGE